MPDDLPNDVPEVTDEQVNSTVEYLRRVYAQDGVPAVVQTLEYQNGGWLPSSTGYVRLHTSDPARRVPPNNRENAPYTAWIAPTDTQPPQRDDWINGGWVSMGATTDDTNATVHSTEMAYRVPIEIAGQTFTAPCPKCGKDCEWHQRYERYDPNAYAPTCTCTGVTE